MPDPSFSAATVAPPKSDGRLPTFVVNTHMHESGQERAQAPGELLTAEEVAFLLRVTPAWVYAETRRHRIPHIRLGRYVRYRSEAIGLWMDELEGRSTVVRGPEGSRSDLVNGAFRPTDMRSDVSSPPVGHTSRRAAYKRTP